jgi:hypothetical protein
MPSWFLTVANLSFELRTQPSSVSFELPPAYVPFVTTAGAVDHQITVRRGSPDADLGALAFAFFSQGIWAAFHWKDGWGFVAPSPRAGDWQRLLLWSPQEQQATLWIRPNILPDDPFKDLTLPFFTALFALHDGILVHAAAIEVAGQAWVFVGPSGSGKSHWAEQGREQGFRVLDEDRIVLRERDGQIWAFGTPWHPEPRLSSPQGAPLSQVFFLQKASPNTVQEVASAARTAAVLLRSTLLPIYDYAAMESVLQVAGDAATQSRSFLLGKATGSAWPHLLEL